MAVLSFAMSTTPEQLTDVLRAVVGAINDAEITEDLREIAFAKSFDFLTADAPAQTGRKSLVPKDPKRDDPQPESDGIAAIARKLKLEGDAVARVFDIDDDGVHLTVAHSALATQRKTAMQEVARLISAGRQGAGIDEEWTSIDAVRAACDNLGVLDAGNFAAAITKIGGAGVRIRGAGRKRELKVNAAGYESARELVTRLAAEQ